MKSKDLSILVVDDDKDVLTLISKTLGAKYNLLLASSPIEAMKIFRKNEIHLLITDIKMPEIDGFTLAQKLRSKQSRLPLIFISSYGKKSSILQAIKANAFDFIEKPIDPNDLNFCVLRARDYFNLNSQLIDLKSELKISHHFSSIGQMTSGVTHEIKSPLIVMQGLNNNNLKYLIDNKRESEVIPIIKENSQKIQNYLLKVFRIIKGMESFVGEAESEEFFENSIYDIVSDAVEIGEYRITQQKKIQMNYESIPKDLTVFCRGVQLAQVVLNLLNNAIDAISKQKEPWIHIDAHSNKHTVTISVTNSGPPIPKEIQKNIFKSSYTEKGNSGSGLGLSICTKIVEAHNGSISLDRDSTHTKFLIELPINQDNFAHVQMR